MNKGIAIFTVLALAASCATQQPGADSPRMSFKASFEDGQSRTALSGTTVLWSAGDAISVFSPSNQNGETYTINDEDAGSSEATFSGEGVGQGPYYALYPADGSASMDGTSLNVWIPGTQTYDPVCFADGANFMVAASDGFSFNFKNLCGLLSVTLTGNVTVTSVSLTSNKAEALCGSGTVDMAYGSTPTLVMDETSAHYSTVTLDCGSGVALTPEGVAFHFIVPAGTLSDGFTVSIFEESGEVMEKSTSRSINIERSKIKAMTAMPFGPTVSPLLELTEWGVYDLSSSTPELVRTYVKGDDQLALRTAPDGSFTFRIQSLPGANALKISAPAGMTVGGEYTLSISSVGSTGVEETSATAVLLKSEDGKLWFKDYSNNRGYIIAGQL